MTDKQMLHWIKDTHERHKNHGMSPPVDCEQTDWLIEQVECFEKMKKDFSDDIDFKRRQILELEEAYDKRKKVNAELLARNKKLQDKLKIYHDALLKIAVGDTWVEYSYDITGQALDEVEKMSQ